MNHSKTYYVLLVILSLSLSSLAQWQPAGDRIRTPWAEQVDPGKVLDEYPRPLMVRSDWKNLNGLWDYAITSLNSSVPIEYEGKILVPFPVESSLSGVTRKVGEDSLPAGIIMPTVWVYWYGRICQAVTNLWFGKVDSTLKEPSLREVLSRKQYTGKS